jgi:hypothetical protein
LALTSRTGSGLPSSIPRTPSRRSVSLQRHHVVALDHRDAHLHALRLRERGDGRRAAGRVHAPGVAHHTDAARHDLGQQLLQRHGDEVGGVAEGRVLQPARRRGWTW